MTRASVVASRSFGPPPPGAGSHPGIAGSVIGWLLVAVVVFLVVKFVRGQRNKQRAQAAAWASALSGVVAEIRATVSAAATASAGGGDARSAVAVNFGAAGSGQLDLDALTRAVADRLVPVLRAELSLSEHERPELLAANGEGRGFAPAGSAGGGESRALAARGVAGRGAGEGVTA